MNFCSVCEKPANSVICPVCKLQKKVDEMNREESLRQTLRNTIDVMTHQQLKNTAQWLGINIE